MAGEIIRQGDKTRHHGTVLEGSPSDICHGKPVAFIGHKVSCPKCSGNHTIVEGVVTTTLYGKGVAVAGMKTSCGAVLIANQFTDVVENAGGGSGGGAAAAAAAVADLNLHVETENYAAGDTVAVDIANDDGSDVATGLPTLKAKGTVAADGTAVIKNVFSGKTVDISSNV